MDQCSSNRVPVLPLTTVSSHNSSARTDTERSSWQSTGLEQDNESLRTKLRQVRDDNARLISLNNELQTELETTRYELHRSSSKTQSLEQSVDRHVSELCTLRESVDAEKARFEHELSEWKCRANESCDAAQRSADTVQQLHSQLEDLKKLRQRVEGERDLALDSAERIQKAYEDFQHHVHDRMQLAQQQIDSTTNDRDKLCSELTSCQAELNSLCKKVQQLTKDCSTERDTREQVERLNADIRAELSRAGLRAADLETKLSSCESVQHENSNLKLTVEHQRVRLERCQAEIGESRAQLAQLEDLTQRLQQSMTSVRGNQKSGQTSHSSLHSLSFSVKGDAFNVSSSSAEALHTQSEDMKTKVAVLESELQQARREMEMTKSKLEAERMEVQRLKMALDSGTEQATGAVAEMAEIGAKTVRELELSLARLEDERENHLSTISTLERHVADLEARKAATDAELAQRGQQLEATQRELADHAAKEAALSRELRKQVVQIASLEHQLDEKVSEIATQVKRSATLGNEVQSLSSELRRAREERDEKSHIAVENASACTQMRQLHDAQCHQMEASIANLSEQNHAMEVALSQSDTQTAELQQRLAAMTEQIDALRQELSQCQHNKQQMTEVLENRAVQAEELASHRETELQCCQAECQQLRGQCIEANNKLQSAQEQLLKLNEMLEDMSRVEMQLKNAVQEQKNRAAELAESSEHDRQQLQETDTKLTELECEQVRLLSQLAQSEHSLQCRTAEYKSEVDSLQKKLDSACVELNRRDDQIHELNNSLRSAQLERSRTMEDLGGQLKTACKQLKQQSKLCDDLNVEISDLKAELDLSAATCKEKDTKMRNLSERLTKVESSVELLSSERTELISEQERLKQTAKTELAEKLEEHDQEVTALRAEIETVRANLRRCEDALRSKEKEAESLTLSLQERQWELQQRAAQLTQLDMAMKDQSSDWDQRLIRLETLLKKSRLETEQRLQQVRQLEEQASELMTALKEKTTKMHQLEELTHKQSTELEAEARQITELERSLSESRKENELASAVNREAENQLSASRTHLETLQAELSEVRSQFTSVSSEHDRLARDLGEAVSLLQAKDAEHARLVQQLAEAGEQRSRLQTAAALDSQTTAERHQVEMVEVRRQLDCARDDVAQLQQQLADAGDRQAALVVELRRMTQQLSSGQMELDASRAIASAQRETILVREAEIARLEARLGLSGRSLAEGSSAKPSGTTSSLPDGGLEARLGLVQSEDGSVKPAGSDVDLAVSMTSGQPGPRREAGSSLELPTSRCHTDNGDRSISDIPNTDSLLAIWHQLQLNESIRQSAGDSVPSTKGVWTAADAPGTTSARLGSALEEKARVQSRIKALIGYREPAKKSATAAPAKPRMSVRPQPLNHSKSSSTASLKQPRRTSNSDLVNTSQLSTAVSHYTASSQDRLTTS